jgi:D-arabinono-1,4-lactone oxidase
MDALLKRELERVSPDVPFRAKTSHRHHTWARTFHSRPELYIQPESTAEIEKIVTLARKCRKRIVVVGSGHSPSDLTCTSSWMVNLDKYNQMLEVNEKTGVMVMQAGIRIYQLQEVLAQTGHTMPNLGSINEQSIAGAISTGTHGSSLKHGLLSESVLGLKLMLSNGRTAYCSAKQNVDLFRAALVSLGAIGIIIEVTFKADRDFNIKWKQDLVPLETILADWEKDLWTSSEFSRVWWMPYMKKAVRWRAGKTEAPLQAPKAHWFSGKLGYHIYHNLLYLGHWFPSILPWVEKFVLSVQYGGDGTSGVSTGRYGLLMNCLYSQFVNEWAIPLAKGPEAITRLSDWLNGNEEKSGIPFSSKGLYVHAPIEVRVSDTSNKDTPRPFLDNTMSDTPTLYLNATLYRPYDRDPPCHLRYYEAFEWLMKEMGGRPHWAKNFYQVTATEMNAFYPEMSEWLRVRDENDPEGMFLGEWHRRYIIPASEKSAYPLEEKEMLRRPAMGGGMNWYGEVRGRTLSPQVSEESFDLMQGAEGEHSVLLDMASDTE